MKLLAFDTCLDKMYVVLRDDDKILSSKIVETTENTYHSAHLISSISEILNENDLKPQNLDLIAVNIGPGSFTGIRACTTVARVMAQQLKIKAIGVSSLEILSRVQNLTNKEILVALDARKSKAYLYNKEIKGAVLLDDVKKIIENNDYYVITDRRLKDILGGIAYEDEDFDLGKILSEIAIEKSKVENCDWRKLHPLYIQPPPIFGK